MLKSATYTFTSYYERYYFIDLILLLTCNLILDKYKEQNTSNPIISPLQSPNGFKKTDYLPTTPPLMKDQSFDDFYNRPKNPLSPSSFR